MVPYVRQTQRELIHHLRSRGLKTSGSKEEQIDRLKASDAQQQQQIPQRLQNNPRSSRNTPLNIVHVSSDQIDNTLLTIDNMTGESRSESVRKNDEQSSANITLADNGLGADSLQNNAISEDDEDHIDTRMDLTPIVLSPSINFQRSHHWGEADYYRLETKTYNELTKPENSVLFLQTIKHYMEHLRQLLPAQVDDEKHAMERFVEMINNDLAWPLARMVVPEFRRPM